MIDTIQAREKAAPVLAMLTMVRLATLHQKTSRDDKKPKTHFIGRVTNLHGDYLGWRGGDRSLSSNTEGLWQRSEALVDALGHVRARMDLSHRC